MKHARRTAFAAVVLSLLFSTHAAAIDLDGFLGEIDVRASADLGAFRADLDATFNVSSGEVDGLFEIFDRPSDVYMALRLGEVCDKPTDEVAQQYRKSKGQGWGAIAKSLGIKPGSAEFHALKAGRLEESTRADASVPGDKGNGRGSSKGTKK